MLPWSKDCDGNDDEWVRRALLGNRRYLQALGKFERRHGVRHPRSPRSAFVPDALRRIIAEVVTERGITLNQLRGKCRARHLVCARRTIAIRARANGCSFPQIGHALHRDHTTIMHHVGAA